MSMQLAHQLGAAKLAKPAAPANRRTAEIWPTAWLPAASRKAEHVMPRHAVLCLPRRRPKYRTALSESHPPSKAIQVIVTKGVVPQNAPFVGVKPRTLVR